MRQSLLAGCSLLALLALFCFVFYLSFRVSSFENQRHTRTNMLKIIPPGAPVIELVQAPGESLSDFLDGATLVADGTTPTLVPKVSRPWTDEAGNVVQLTTYPTTTDTQTSLCVAFDRALAAAQVAFPCIP
jgi:hypothetical protein